MGSALLVGSVVLHLIVDSKVDARNWDARVHRNGRVDRGCHGVSHDGR